MHMMKAFNHFDWSTHSLPGTKGPTSAGYSHILHFGRDRNLNLAKEKHSAVVFTQPGCVENFQTGTVCQTRSLVEICPVVLKY